MREEAGGQLQSWQRPNSGFERRKIGFVGGQHPWCEETAMRPSSAVLVTTTEAKRKRSSDIITRMGTQKPHPNTSRCICVAEGLTIITCESVSGHASIIQQKRTRSGSVKETESTVCVPPLPFSFSALSIVTLTTVQAPPGDS